MNVLFVLCVFLAIALPVAACVYLYLRMDSEPTPQERKTIPCIVKDMDPVEAAMLLKVTPGRIFTMIMFGLMSKGNVKLTSTEPVRLEPVSGIGLNYYEKMFVNAIRNDTLDDTKLPACYHALNQRVSSRLRDADLPATRSYYRTKIEEARADLDAVETPELRLRKYGDNALWLIADAEFERKIGNASLSGIADALEPGDQQRTAHEIVIRIFGGKAFPGHRPGPGGIFHQPVRLGRSRI
jgi:hypothetical protein